MHLRKINKTIPNLSFLSEVLLEKLDNLWGFLQLKLWH